MVLLLLERGGDVSLLEVEVILEGLIAVQRQWAGINPPTVVEFDTLKVISLLCRKDSCFAKFGVLIIDIFYVRNSVNIFLFVTSLERRTKLPMPYQLWHLS